MSSLGKKEIMKSPIYQIRSQSILLLIDSLCLQYIIHYSTQQGSQKESKNYQNIQSTSIILWVHISISFLILIIFFFESNVIQFNNLFTQTKIIIISLITICVIVLNIETQIRFEQSPQHVSFTIKFMFILFNSCFSIMSFQSNTTKSRAIFFNLMISFLYLIFRALPLDDDLFNMWNKFLFFFISISMVLTINIKVEQYHQHTTIQNKNLNLNTIIENQKNPQTDLVEKYQDSQVQQFSIQMKSLSEEPFMKDQSNPNKSYKIQEKIIKYIQIILFFPIFLFRSPQMSQNEDLQLNSYLKTKNSLQESSNSPSHIDDITHYSMIMNIIPDGLMILGKYQQIKFMNLSLMRLFQCENKETIKNQILLLRNSWFNNQNKLKQLGGLAKGKKIKSINLDQQKQNLNQLSLNTTTSPGQNNKQKFDSITINLENSRRNYSPSEYQSPDIKRFIYTQTNNSQDNNNLNNFNSNNYKNDLNININLENILKPDGKSDRSIIEVLKYEILENQSLQSTVEEEFIAIIKQLSKITNQNQFQMIGNHIKMEVTYLTRKKFLIF